MSSESLESSKFKYFGFSCSFLKNVNPIQIFFFLSFIEVWLCRI